MKRFLLTAFSLFLSLFSHVTIAQFTSVTATITDTDGQTWNNGNWTATLVNPVPQVQPTVNGTTLTAAQMHLSGAMNSSGVITATLASNAVIVPAGTYWTFTICPNASVPCSTVNDTVSGASQNISAALSAGVRVVRFTASPTSYGYADAEVAPIPNPGGQYYNVSSLVNRIWNGTIWTTAAGGSGTPGGANTDVQYNSLGTFGGDANFKWISGTGLVLPLDAFGAVTAGSGPADDFTTWNWNNVVTTTPYPSSTYRLSQLVTMIPTLGVDDANVHWSALEGLVETGDDHNYHNMFGGQMQAYHTHAGAVSVMQGGAVGAFNAGSGAVGTQEGGAYTSVNSSTGTIALNRGLSAITGNQGSGLITTNHTVEISANAGAGPITNNVGLYINNQTGGGTNFNMYSVGAAASNYFEGVVTANVIKRISVTDGCASWTSNVLGSTGTACGAGGGTPGGSNTQIQFNDSGSFGGDAGLVYNKATATETVTHIVATDITTGGGSTSTCLTEPIVGDLNVGASGAANDCSANPATGNINAASVNSTTIPSSATLTVTIASGTAALGTSAIGSGAKASVVTVAATGTLTTDAIIWNPNADISGVTGYGPSASGALSICSVWPTANAVNFEVCNNTLGSITPGAVTLNFRVVR